MIQMFLHIGVMLAELVSRHSIVENSIFKSSEIPIFDAKYSCMTPGKDFVITSAIIPLVGVCSNIV